MAALRICRFLSLGDCVLSRGGALGHSDWVISVGLASSQSCVFEVCFHLTVLRVVRCMESCRVPTSVWQILWAVGHRALSLSLSHSLSLYLSLSLSQKPLQIIVPWGLAGTYCWHQFGVPLFLSAMDLFGCNLILQRTKIGRNPQCDKSVRVFRTFLRAARWNRITNWWQSFVSAGLSRKPSVGFDRK